LKHSIEDTHTLKLGCRLSFVLSDPNQSSSSPSSNASPATILPYPTCGLPLLSLVFERSRLVPSPPLSLRVFPYRPCACAFISGNGKTTPSNLEKTIQAPTHDNVTAARESRHVDFSEPREPGSGGETEDAGLSHAR
jgi:hypothetical protein